MRGVRLYCVTLFFCPDERLTSIKQTLPQLHYRTVLERSGENTRYCSSTVSHVASVRFLQLLKLFFFHVSCNGSIALFLVLLHCN